MAAWWSTVSDGLQRLVGRVQGSSPDAPDRSVPLAADVPPARPPQAWPWQPPVQRALDPDWAPRLRPDDFAAGLSSHQDPTFRRDLVHEVHPGVGGLADGLADLVPGQPRTQPPTSALTVRPVRPAAPAVQRTFASFAASDAAGELTTVAMDPPWLAEPIEPAVAHAPTVADERIEPVEPAGQDEPPPVVGLDVTPTSAATPVEPPRPVATTPAATPRDVRVQRHETASETVAPPADAPPAGVSDAPPRPEAPVLLPVVPTVARKAGTAGSEPSATPVLSGWVLPVVAAAPPPRSIRPELPVARTLPVLQRSVVPAAPTGPTAPIATTGPTHETLSAGSSPQVEVRPESSEPPAEATTLEPTDEPRPETAPLSGFAQAIEQLEVEPAPDHRPLPDDAVVAGPVVPGPRAPANERPVTDVQRDATAEASVAPLLGIATGEPAVGELLEPPALQRAAYADLPVVPVAHDEGSRPGEAGGDVPRLPVAATPPVVSRTAVSQPPVSGPDVSRPVVSRPGLPQPTAARPTVSRTVGPGTGPTAAPHVMARSTAAPRPTAPLTGARPPAVQRRTLGPPPDVAPAVREPVQPLRFDSITAPPSPRSSRTPEPLTVRSDVSAEPRLQRSTQELPAVAPGLVGPATSEIASKAAVQLRAAAVPEAAATWSSVGAPAYGSNRPADRPVQRLAAPGSLLSSTRPVPVRSLPFDQMFQGSGEAGAPRTAYAEPGWTSVDLPVVSDAPTAVQRAVDTDAITVEPIAPAPGPAPAPEPAAPEPAAPAPAAPASSPAAPGGAPGGLPGGADLDEMARRLFDPLSARLRAELWLDRERAGLVADAHF